MLSSESVCSMLHHLQCNMIKDIVSKYVIVKDNNFARCPFHRDTIWLLYIDEWSNQAFCPICNKSWTPVSFVADKEKLRSYEAYVKVMNPPMGEWWEQAYRDIEKLVELFHNQYKLSPAQEYMLWRWVDDSTAEYYMLGYNKKENRVVFPIKNLYWRYVWFTARSIDWSQPKYKNSSNSNIFQKKRLLYWYDADFSYGSYVLCEGQMDVIKLQSVWYGNAVCSSGTAINRDQLIWMKHIHILYDQDEAGAKATRRVIDLCEELQITYSVINLPDGKDPDEFISNGWDIFSVVPYEGDITRIDSTNRSLYLSSYATIPEETIEQSMVSKHWTKIASDTVLNYYLGKIYTDAIRYTIQKELRFRKWDHSNDWVSIDDLKTSISIETVIESYGIKIPSSRMNLPCPLPDHKDGTPSFSINKAHNLFKCFGCNKWWTQIDFIQNMEQCDIKTAIIKFKTYASNNQS